MRELVQHIKFRYKDGLTYFEVPKRGIGTMSPVGSAVRIALAAEAVNTKQSLHVINQNWEANHRNHMILFQVAIMGKDNVS